MNKGLLSGFSTAHGIRSRQSIVAKLMNSPHIEYIVQREIIDDKAVWVRHEILRVSIIDNKKVNAPATSPVGTCFEMLRKE